MPKSQASKEYNQFVAGLNTELNPTNADPRASKDELNFVLKRDGSRERRLGMSYESNYGLIDSGFSNELFESYTKKAYLWKAPNNDTLVNLYVVQIGNKLYFFDANKDSQTNDYQSIGSLNFSDDFDRSDEALSNSPNWEERPSGFSAAGMAVISNQASSAFTGSQFGTRPVFCVPDAVYNFGTEYWCTTKVTALPASGNSFLGLAVECENISGVSNDAILATPENDGSITLRSLTAGSITSTAAGVITTDDTLGLHINSSGDVTVYVNSVSVLSSLAVTTPVQNQPGYAGTGAAVTGASAEFDDFKAGDGAFYIAGDTPESVTLGANYGTVMSFATLSGKLIIASGDQTPRYVTYDPDAGTFQVSSYTLDVRDIWGVYEGTAVDDRPTTLTVAHQYNLLNAGWKSLADINSFKTTTAGYYPSLADLYNSGIDDTDNDIWKAALVNKQNIGTSKAPVGRFILDLFTRGDDRSLQVAGQLQDASIGGLSAVESYAGRLFYSGFQTDLTGGDLNSPLLGNYVVFSQVVDNVAGFGLCYQAASPTSNEQSDLVDSDGGTIKINEASGIHTLISTGRSLLVFATNGIWSISGGPEGIFSATNLEVTQVSNTGSNSPGSIVKAEGKIYYWSDGGIYVIDQDKVTLGLSAQSLSENTIQTFFFDIDPFGREIVAAAYDAANKRIHWVYPTDGGAQPYSELIFDLVLNAFVPHEYSRTDSTWPYLLVPLTTPAFITSANQENVTDSSVTVTDSAVAVTSTLLNRSPLVTNIKYLIAQPGSTTKFTFADVNNNDFMDFVDFDSVGLDAPAHAQSWEETLDDTQRYKQAKYITCNFRRTETGFELVTGTQFNLISPSGCLVTPYWDYADSTTAGKTGTQFQAYRLGRLYIPDSAVDPFDYGQSVISTKSKLKGRGKALSIRFDSEPGKDLKLLGYGIDFTGGTTV